MTLEAYVRTDAESFQKWKNALEGEKNSSAFFEEYSAWITNSSSSRSEQERFTYYESIKKVTSVSVNTVPGSREKDGYVISAKRAKECLEQMMHAKEAEIKQEKQ